MQRTLLAAALAALPVAAQAAGDISTEIASNGIAPTLARLSALTDPTPSDRFAIGGLEFLATLESVYRYRWETGLTETEFVGMMFGGHAALPSNPAPGPLTSEGIVDLFQDMIAGMQRARAQVDQIADDDAVEMRITLSDLWFDINGNHQRDEFENANDLIGRMILGWRWMHVEGPQEPIAIRFDTADARWLSAYTSLVSGMAEFALAFDPGPEIDKVLSTRDEILAIRERREGDHVLKDVDGLDGFIDTTAIVLGVLRNQPDANRTRAARDHWLTMIDRNRAFWALVALETDNEDEWIPKDETQKSALPLFFPARLDKIWAEVLDDAEGLLNGTKSVPFWRANIGIDISKWLDSPAPLDLAGVIQGWAVAPYFTEAPGVTSQSMRAFERLLSGEDAFLMAVVLN